MDRLLSFYWCVNIRGYDGSPGTGWVKSDFYNSANFEIFPADPNIISLNSESGQDGCLFNFIAVGKWTCWYFGNKEV